MTEDIEDIGAEEGERIVKINVREALDDALHNEGASEHDKDDEHRRTLRYVLTPLQRAMAAMSLAQETLHAAMRGAESLGLPIHEEIADHIATIGCESSALAMIWSVTQVNQSNTVSATGVQYEPMTVPYVGPQDLRDVAGMGAKGGEARPESWHLNDHAGERPETLPVYEVVTDGTNQARQEQSRT